MFIDGTGIVIVHNTSFQNNTSDQDGGVAVIFNATLSVSQSHVYENTVSRHGGAVVAFQDSILAFETTTVNHNRATLDGGAEYMHGSSATVRDCDFRTM